MIKNKKILALIPARGGSKGIKNKNIRDLADKPLIAYSIETACKSKYIDSVVVSTDNIKISSVALKFGARVPFMRPKNIAGDKTPMISVVLDALKQLDKIGEKYDICILLQPTQPLRTVDDIDASLEQFIKNGQKSLVSICEVENHPLLMRRKSETNKLTKFIKKRSDVNRQDMEKYYYVNGAIYINKVGEITMNLSLNDNKTGYIMPRTRSIDIDEEIDLIIAELMVKHKEVNEKQK